MRLLLWVFLVTLVTLFSHSEANTNKSIRRVLVGTLVTRGGTVNSAFDKDKMIIRNGDLNINEEERAISQKLKDVLKKSDLKLRNLLNSIKTKYLKWEQGLLKSRFEELAKQRKTYDDVMKDFQTRMSGTGWWTTPSGFKRFARLYNTWLTKNHPDLARPIK